jgi:hypothetical protein
VADYINNRVRFIDYLTGRPLLPASPSAIHSKLDKVPARACAVEWTAVPASHSGYLIRRYTQAAGRCLPDSFHATAPPNTTAFRDLSAPQAVCAYAVAAVNAGGVSGYTLGWIGSDPARQSTAPRTPVEVNAVKQRITRNGVPGYRATLAWIDAAQNEDKVLVQRFVANGDDCVEDTKFGTVTLPAGAVSYTDNTITPNTCAYRVSMANSAGVSMPMGDRDLTSKIEQFYR